MVADARDFRAWMIVLGGLLMVVGGMTMELVLVAVGLAICFWAAVWRRTV